MIAESVALSAFDPVKGVVSTEPRITTVKILGEARSILGPMVFATAYDFFELSRNNVVRSSIYDALRNPS